MNQAAVLIISDDAEFARSVASRWQRERPAPAFTVMSTDLFSSDIPGMTLDRDVATGAFDLAILDGIPEAQLPVLLDALRTAHKAVLLLSKKAGEPAALGAHVLCLPKSPEWLDALVLVAREILKRTDMAKHARCLEQANATLNHQAILGRYMLEMRHTLNNALTSVLGNSELLLLEPGTFATGPRSQIETLRNMAMRIHEILQRFSSLDKECSLLEGQARQEIGLASRVAAVGS